jgi:hypothetical protein
MTPDEIRRLIAARAPELSEADPASLSAETGEEMIPASILSQVLEVIEMLEARMIALEGNAQDGELDAVA